MQQSSYVENNSDEEFSGGNLGMLWDFIMLFQCYHDIQTMNPDDERWTRDKWCKNKQH